MEGGVPKQKASFLDNAACGVGIGNRAIPDLGREVDPQSPLEHIPPADPRAPAPNLHPTARLSLPGSGPRQCLRSMNQLSGLVLDDGCLRQTAMGRPGERSSGTRPWL